MPLRPYEEFAPEALGFPIGGKVYVAPPIGYREGLRLAEMIKAGPDAKFDENAEDIWRMVLGPAYQQMKDDNVPGEALARAAFAALTDFQFGREAAEQVWESGIDPKALAEAVTRRAQEAATAPAKPASTRSRSTASASRTRKPASTRSTTSRKK